MNIWLLEPLFVPLFKHSILTFDYWQCPKLYLESQKWFPRVEITFPLQVEICFTLSYNQLIKINNHIFKTRIAWIPLRLAVIIPNISCHSAMDTDLPLSESFVCKKYLQFSKTSYGCSSKKMNEKHHEKKGLVQQNSPDQGAK